MNHILARFMSEKYIMVNMLIVMVFIYNTGKK